MNVDAEVFGPYRLDELLGRGGMGEVYRAYDLEFERTVAVKRLSAHLADDPRFQERFRREAHHVARLRNPHIVPIHRFGEINGQLYIDMRYVEGGDLADLIRTTGPLPPDRAVRILEHLASALDDAHANGLVHRDVKPSNALLDRRVADFCYLADFGITRLATDRRSNSLTRTGALLGSLAYMAPEQFDGMVTMQSDIYSLTCVFYEMLTGARPYDGDALPVLMHAHIKVAAPRPSERNPAAAAFDEVVATGMAKVATDRFTSAGALAAAARAALAGHAAPATADDEPTRPERELTTLAGTTVDSTPAANGTPATGADSDVGEKPDAPTPTVSRGFHHGESAIPTRRVGDSDTVSLQFRHGELGLSARRVGNSDTASPGGRSDGSRSGGRGAASADPTTGRGGGRGAASADPTTGRGGGRGAASADPAAGLGEADLGASDAGRDPGPSTDGRRGGAASGDAVAAPRSATGERGGGSGGPDTLDGETDVDARTTETLSRVRSSLGPRWLPPLAVAAVILALVGATWAIAQMTATVAGTPSAARNPAPAAAAPASSAASSAAPAPGAAPPAGPVLTEAVFTGRTSDNAITLAVGIKDGRAAATSATAIWSRPGWRATSTERTSHCTVATRAPSSTQRRASVGCWARSPWQASPARSPRRSPPARPGCTRTSG